MPAERDFTRKFKSLNPAFFILLSVIVSAAISLAASALISLGLLGRLRHEILLAALPSAVLATLAVAAGFVKFIIKEHRKANAALEESSRFLNTIFDSIRDPFSIVDRGLRVVRANEAYARLKDVDVSELTGGRRCHEVLQGRQEVCPDCIIERSFRQAAPCSKEKLVRREGGQEAWLEIYTYPIFDESGAVSHVIEYIRDITARKRAEAERVRLIEELEHLSRTDSLTGLLNKRALADRLEYEVARAKRYGSDLSLLICDLDFFKEINDTYGHHVGDRVMARAAQVLLGLIRRADILGRYGGDEFIIMLPQTGRVGAVELAERLRAAVEGTNFGDDLHIRLTMSTGLASLAGKDDDHNQLIRRADQALYASKRSGRNQVSVG